MCYNDHSKYVCSKNFLIVKKTIQLPLWSLFDKRIHILWRLSLHGLIFKYNEVLKYLYGRGKVLVYNKMAKMANFWKISHFSRNGDLLEKVGKSRDFPFLAFATFWKKSRLFEKLKSRDFFQPIFWLREKIATFKKVGDFSESFSTLNYASQLLVPFLATK